MFSLNNYVNALLELVLQEKSRSKRKEIVAAWVKTLKKHHRDLEGQKILKLLDSRAKELTRGAQVTVSDEKEAQVVNKYFQKKGIPIEVEIQPEILGGTKIVWDNLMIDNTINHQLDKLNRSIGR
jgi:F0F1-type ATP synthase delta subunit